MSYQALVVDVAGYEFGLPLGAVREVLRAASVIRTPQMPPSVLGVIKIRGELVPVIDLRRSLGIPSKAIEPSDRFVVVDGSESAVILPVDGVQDLIETDGESMSSPGVTGLASQAIQCGTNVVFVYDIGDLGIENATAQQTIAEELAT